MPHFIKVTVLEANFHEEVLVGRDIYLNLRAVRMILQNETNSILFFQNEDCLKVEPKLPADLLVEHSRLQLQADLTASSSLNLRASAHRDPL